MDGELQMEMEMAHGEAAARGGGGIGGLLAIKGVVAGGGIVGKALE